MRKVRIPHTLVLVFTIIIVVAASTWIIPAGEFERAPRDGRTVVVPDTYRGVEPNPQGPGDVLSAPLRGFVAAANVIAFIFIVGGAFGIVNATGVVHSTITSVASRVEHHPTLRNATIPLLMTLFSLGGATFGMSEEVLAFVFMFIPFARALGYDSIVGASIPFVGASLGFAAAFINPFTLGIAQGIAELPLLSGIEYRILCWFVVTGTGIWFVMRYASRIKFSPRLSPVFTLDNERVDSIKEARTVVDSSRNRAVLVVLLLSLLALVYGAVELGWYITELSALFLATGIIAGIAARLPLTKLATSFVGGAKEMMVAALVVAFSRGILVVATDGKIIDTMLSALSGVLQQGHPVLSAWLMLGVQTCINFFVPSGSGQAALTMPIMAPLSDLLGISRQTAVLVFQFGDGITNLIIPTSGVTMGVLGIANIPWEVWARWILKLVMMLFGVSLVLIALPVLFGWGPH